MKKEIIYIIFIAILVIFIGGITFLKITSSDYNVDNNNGNTNNVDINNSNIDDNNLVNNLWIKERSEYHRDLSVKYQDELIKHIYVEFKETSLEFCNNNEDNEIECNEYNYSIEDNILTVYDSNNNEITYTYEIRDDNQFVLINDNEGSVWTNYYSMVLG